MSDRINKRISFWSGVHNRLHSTRYRASIDIDSMGHRQIGDAYTLMLMVWSDATTCPLSKRTIDRMVTSLQCIPIELFFSVLKDSDDALLDEISRSWRHFQPDRSFKRSVPFGKEQLFEPFYEWFEQVSRVELDVLSAFRVFHQIYSFIGRLTLRKRVDLEEEALQKWLDTQAELAPYDSYDESYRFLNYWFRNWFSSEDDKRRFFEFHHVRHSDGQVAETCVDTLDKYLNMGTDDLLEWWASEVDVPLPPYVTNRPLLRRSVLRFVPKSTTKLRSICMEPASLQFFQQGMFSSFLNYFASHRFLRHHVDLRRAELNRFLAEEGSYDGSFATIDLSEASDRITLAQVGVACEGTFIWDGLQATRCSHVLLPNGQTFRLRSFATMGSACCFPVETLIFVACACEAIRRCGESPYTSRFRVYGDDIVIERRFARMLMSILNDLGYKVNKEKSFFTNVPYTFRESCGGEYVHGYDVTPCRISRKFFTLDPVWMRRDSSHYQAAIDLANEMTRFPTCRMFIIRQLLKMRKKEQPLFTDDPLDSSAIYSPTPTNFHLIKAEARGIFHGHPYDYQCWKVLHGSVASPAMRSQEEGVAEEYRYYDALRSMDQRPDSFRVEDSCVSAIARKDARPRKRLTNSWSYLYGIGG